MFRRLSMLLLVAAAGLAACSSSGGPVTSPPTNPTPGSIAVSIGNTADLGGALSYQLNVVVTNSKGQPISGQYADPVTLTTSDTADIAFSSDFEGSTVSSSVTITNSTQSVFLIYDEKSVGLVDIMAKAGSATQTVAFDANGGAVSATSSPNPTGSGTATTSPVATPSPTPAPFIASLYVSTAGAPPFPPGASATGPGSQPIFITARDQNGNSINGTYPSTINVTINNASQLDLSLTSYMPAVDCTGMTTCGNNAAVTVTQAGSTIFGNYTTNFTTAQVSVTTVSTDTAGNKMTIECSAINFPLQNGSSPYTCQPVNSAPNAVARDTHRVKTNQTRAEYFSKN